FEYVSDDATSFTGFAVSGIQVPEIGFAADSGWTAEGFQRVEAPLEQKFIVQVIEGGTPAKVTRLEMDAANHAEITFDSPLTIVVAAVTEGTTEVAPYRWSLAALRSPLDHQVGGPPTSPAALER